MDATALALKTDKGQEEIRSRAHGLPQKLRTLLIMVDGKSTVGQLLGRFPGVQEVQDNLELLVKQGFVQLAGSGGGAPAAGAVPSAAPAAAGETKAQALSGLTRMLLDALGPDADLVTGELERARTRAEVEAAAARCARMLEGMAGARKAGAFEERARAYVLRWFPG